MRNALNLRHFQTEDKRQCGLSCIGVCLYYQTHQNYFVTIGDTYRELKLLARQYYQTTSMLIKSKVNLSNLLDQVKAFDPRVGKAVAAAVSEAARTSGVARI